MAAFENITVLIVAIIIFGLTGLFLSLANTKLRSITDMPSVIIPSFISTILSWMIVGFSIFILILYFIFRIPPFIKTGNSLIIAIIGLVVLLIIGGLTLISLRQLRTVKGVNPDDIAEVEKDIRNAIITMIVGVIIFITGIVGLYRLGQCETNLLKLRGTFLETIRRSVEI